MNYIVRCTQALINATCVPFNVNLKRSNVLKFKHSEMNEILFKMMSVNASLVPLNAEVRTTGYKPVEVPSPDCRDDGTLPFSIVIL